MAIVRPEGLCQWNDTIGNRTRDLPVCSAVPQPTAPPRAPFAKLFIYIIIQQVEKCVHIFLLPFINYVIFFLQLCLSFHSSSTNPFSPISPPICSTHVSLGLPRFLLLGGRHFITSFGNLPSSILLCIYILSIIKELVQWRRNRDQEVGVGRPKRRGSIPGSGRKFVFSLKRQGRLWSQMSLS
jgi:hypothetical protein